MWRLLAAEINYNKYTILIASLISVVCFIAIWYGVHWERNRVPLTMLVMLVAVIMVVYAGEGNRVKQKRDRLHASLSVPLNRIGLLHQLLPLLIWLGILGVYFCAYFLSQSLSSTQLTKPSIMQLITLNGLLLTVNGAFLVNRDFRLVVERRAAKAAIYIFWFCIYIAVLSPFFIVMNFGGLFGENTALQRSLNSMISSPYMVNVLGVMISIFSYQSFVKRNSFIET